MRKLAIAIAASLSFAGASVAAPITVPTGLVDGDSYRLIFTTSTSTDALSSSIATYDAFVTAVALSVPELAALGTTWRVVASTTSISARDHTGTNPLVETGVPIYRLDDTLRASTNALLWTPFSHPPLDVDETGSPIVTSTPGERRVWTGTLADGTASLIPLGTSPEVSFGRLNSSNDNWIERLTGRPSVENYRLYAISGVLTVPEAGSSTLVAVGLLAIGLVRRRVR